MSHNFALIGAAGFVAPRHLKAIRDTGNRLVAATDPHDSVGVLDQYFLEARFFPERALNRTATPKMRRGPDVGSRVDHLRLAPYLHDAHCRLALRLGAAALCEKPLVISPWNLDQLAEMEEEHGGRIYNVLQLRLHDNVRRLKAQLDAEKNRSKVDIELTYVTRGAGPGTTRAGRATPTAPARWR